MNKITSQKLPAANNIRIAIVDPRPVVRLGIQAVIKNQPELSVVGEASDCRGVMALLEDVAADVLIADPDLSDVRGADFLQQLREKFPALVILVFSNHKNSACVLEAIRNGAQGYLTKEAEPAQIVDAIRGVMAGTAYIDPRVAMLILGLIGNAQDGHRCKVSSLTERERAVLNLLANGKRNKDISEILCISEHTVKFHLTGLLQKFQANNRTDVVTKAFNLGLIRV